MIGGGGIGCCVSAHVSYECNGCSGQSCLRVEIVCRDIERSAGQGSLRVLVCVEVVAVARGQATHCHLQQEGGGNGGSVGVAVPLH